MFFLIIILLNIQSCKNKEEQKLIIKYEAKYIDFSTYNFTIDFQDEIYNKTILFDAYVDDIFRENGKIYFLFTTEKAQFKLSSDSMNIENYSKDFKMYEKVKILALINDFDFYQMDNGDYDPEKEINWVSPCVVCKGILFKIIKN